MPRCGNCVMLFPTLLFVLKVIWWCEYRQDRHFLKAVGSIALDWHARFPYLFVWTADLDVILQFHHHV